MAQATLTTTAQPMHPKHSPIIQVRMPQRALRASQALTPLTTSGKSFEPAKSSVAGASRLDSNKAHAAQRAKQEQWATLNLRQEWADAAFMRGHLSMAGLRVKCSTEPATVSRIKNRLRAIGIHSPEIQEAIGMPLARFLKVNTGLPLWAALALVLESMGRFTPEMGGSANTAGSTRNV